MQISTGKFKWLFRILAVLILPVGLVWVNSLLISFSTQFLIKPESAIKAGNNFVVIPGSGSTEGGDWINYTFEHRMLAAWHFYQHDTAAVFFLSGMVRPPFYKEPYSMRERLLAYGIPAQQLILDTLGVRTWITVGNAGRSGKGKNIWFISQEQHLERMLYCALLQGVNARGITADPPQWKHRYWSYREYGARVKATLDGIAFRLKIE